MTKPPLLFFDAFVPSFSPSCSAMCGVAPCVCCDVMGVWRQLFNEFNARSIGDDVNVLRGVCGNPIFGGVIAFTVATQYLLVEHGGKRHVYVCDYVYGCVYVHVHVCVCVYVYVCVHVYVHVYVSMVR